MTDDELAAWTASSLRAANLDVNKLAAADEAAFFAEAEACGLALLDGYRALHARGEITDDEFARIVDEISALMDEEATA